MNQFPNSQPLLKIIHEKITHSAQQKITFAEYMNTVLYHPIYGYYCADGVKIGSQGDFFTASSLGSDFGEMLARQVIEIWQHLSYPNPFILIEMGAGSGQLASDILQTIEKEKPELLKKLHYWIIETSESLIQQQKKQLNEWQKTINLQWKTWAEIPDNSLIGCLFSNELVDAFPVHRIKIEKEKLQEIYVTISENKIEEITGELSTPSIIDYFQLIKLDFPSPAYPDSYETEVNLSALDWLKTIARKLHRGYLITIDYGYPAPKYYHPQRYQGTLNCYYQHRHHHNPYVNLGYQDITAHVDFTALECQGELSGLKKVGLTQQGLFLMALGLGEKFKELSQGKFDLQTILHCRDQLHQLINPTGLGGFTVLVQSKGLTPEEKGKLLTGLTSPALMP